MKMAVIQLKQAFIITSIFDYFDSKYQIKMKTYTLNYDIYKNLYELTLNKLSYQYFVAFFLEKKFYKEPGTRPIMTSYLLQ